MRAIVQDGYGPYAEVLHLRQQPAPAAGPGQVLVRVHATSVHADVWHAIEGIPYVLRLMGSGVRSPRTCIPGTDLAGEVLALGPGATRFALGDRVFGEVTPTNQWRNAGTFAELVAADETSLALVPDHLSYEEAAAVPTSALIALTNLRDQGRIEAGQRVLVNGAGGAVGVFALQLAKAFGAEVTAVEVPEKLALVADLGADHVVDGVRQDFTTLGVRYDLVFDVVSTSPYSAVRRVLEPDGAFVLIGHDQYGRSGHRWLGSLGRMLPLLARAPFDRRIPGIRPGAPREESLATIVDLLAARRIRPVVDDRTFPLEHVVDALDHLTTGTAKGRVILTV